LEPTSILPSARRILANQMPSLYIATNERVSKETKERASKQKNSYLNSNFVTLLSSGTV
jgi:hypothetical protein